MRTDLARIDAALAATERGNPAAPKTRSNLERADTAFATTERGRRFASLGGAIARRGWLSESAE
jgi:hypothetical protein